MKRKSRVCGEYPKTLYRFFDKKEYALRFIEAGHLRAGLLSGYKKIECESRRDETEGRSHYRLREMVTSGIFSQDSSRPAVWKEEMGVGEHHGEQLNLIHLICCSRSLENLEEKKRKFGDFVVRIASPVSLAIDLDYALNGNNGEGRNLIVGASVSYSKGEILEGISDSKDCVDLAYTQKPPTFSDEHEFRFCLFDLSQHRAPIPKEDDHRYIEIGHHLKYAELIKT